MQVDDILVYFVRERESIRVKRANLTPPPWSSDLIFRTYRFCNVRRRDDRVSCWLLEHVLLQKHIDYDLQSFLLFSAWCRWVNWPPTIAEALRRGFYPQKEVDWEGLGKFVDQFGATQKTWTGAYMICTPKRGEKKGCFVARDVIGCNLASILPKLIPLFTSNAVSLSECWSLLHQANYFGSFMAGQVIADWSYTSLLSRAVDLYTWAPMGPGSVRGYNRLLSITPLTKRPREEDWLQHLWLWRNQVIAVLGKSYCDLDMMSVQSVLCEVDKYLRVKNGEGYPREKYKHHVYSTDNLLQF